MSVLFPVLPNSWQRILAELAITCSWTPQVIDDLTLSDLLWWWSALSDVDH